MEYMTMFKIIIIFMLFFGGAGYLIYIKSRSKKQKWTAYIYQLGAGVREENYKDKNGKILGNLKLKDLKPYAKDVLVKEQLAHGVTTHTLKRLGITTNTVTADMVEVWGKEKFVRVLIVENTATILKVGYDKDFGETVFRPEKREKVEHMTSEMNLQNERYKPEKDILTAISPWIIALIICGTLLGSIYIGGEAGVKISDNIAKSNEQSLAVQLQLVEMMNQTVSANIKLIQEGERQRIIKEQEKIIIPSIE